MQRFKPALISILPQVARYQPSDHLRASVFFFQRLQTCTRDTEYWPRVLTRRYTDAHARVIRSRTADWHLYVGENMQVAQDTLQVYARTHMYARPVYTVFERSGRVRDAWYNGSTSARERERERDSGWTFIKHTFIMWSVHILTRFARTDHTRLKRANSTALIVKEKKVCTRPNLFSACATCRVARTHEFRCHRWYSYHLVVLKNAATRLTGLNAGGFFLPILRFLIPSLFI